MAVLTATTATRAGTTAVPATAATLAGDECLNPGGDLIALVKNGGASPITVTEHIRAPGPDGAAVTNPTLSVAAGDTQMFGPFPTSLYNDSDGKVKISYSSATSVTVKFVRVIPNV